jgi:hypothetical protein
VFLECDIVTTGKQEPMYSGCTYTRADGACENHVSSKWKPLVDPAWGVEVSLGCSYDVLGQALPVPPYSLVD